LKRTTSLTARAFLFAFVPLCVVLAVSFLALNAVVERRVKQGLRESLERSEQLLAQANEEHSRRIAQFTAVLANDPGLRRRSGCCASRCPTQTGPWQCARPSKRSCAIFTGWLGSTSWR
jgi:hypothetical protein